MASDSPEKQSSPKFVQNGNHQATKVRFDIDDSHDDTDTHESSDKHFGCSTNNSNTNGKKHLSTTISGDEKKPMLKRYTR